MPNAILLAGYVTYPQEALAGEELTPGHLVTFGSGGTAGKLIKHATAIGNAAPAFVDVHPVPASGATAPIDSTYPAGDNVKWFIPHKGAEVYAWVPASASAIIKGDLLTSNGDGTLKKFVAPVIDASTTSTYTVAVTAIVGMAAEAKDNSANTTTPVRIRVYTL